MNFETKRDKEDTLSFWHALFSSNTSIKSLPFRNYDFYSDCILRHLDTNPISVIDGQRRWSYFQIHELVSKQLHPWKAFGLSQGKKVALILPQGIDFIIALMTALRLGLIIAIFPLEDPYFSLSQVKKALEDSSFDGVITPSSFQYLSPSALSLDLNIQGEIDLEAPSHSYDAKDPVFFSIDTNDAFLCPLRDSIQTLPLKKGTVWARPLSSFFLDEPFATLTSFLAGATIYHTKEATLLSNPEHLKYSEIEILGVSPRLLDLWTKTAGCPQSQLKLWYKSPFLGNHSKWKHFNTINNLKKISCCDILIDPKKGGVILASDPQPYSGQSFLSPPSGVSWKLLNLNGNGEESREGVGYFEIEPKLILGQVQDQWVISWSQQPIQNGIFYPTKNVELCVETLNFVLACIAIAERDPKDFISSQITLIIFTDIEKYTKESYSWEEKVHHQIKQDLGEAYYPNHILFFPFYPRYTHGKLNRTWALGQYQRGLLSRKNKSPIYHQLNLFRKTLYHRLAEI